MKFNNTTHRLLLVPTEDCIVSLFGASTVAEDLIFVAICVQIDSTSPLTNAVSVNYNTVPLTATGKLYNI